MADQRMTAFDRLTRWWYREFYPKFYRQVDKLWRTASPDVKTSDGRLVTQGESWAVHMVSGDELSAWGRAQLRSWLAVVHAWQDRWAKFDAYACGIEDDRLVAIGGVALREASTEAGAIRIALFGGMYVDPAYRTTPGRGLMLQRARVDFAKQSGCDFALLICRPELVPYNERSGWRVFQHDVYYERYGQREAMGGSVATLVLALTDSDPVDADIDLCGLPA